jgi:hypothetical protein
MGENTFHIRAGEPIMRYKLPTICASCGVERGTKIWSVKTRSVGINPLTLITMIFGVGIISRKSQTFTVQVCDACLEKYQQRQDLRKQIAIGGFIFGIAGIFLWTILASARQADAAALCIAILIVGGLGIVIVHAVLNNAPGSYDGMFFKFKNETFHQEFAKLNPELVRPFRPPY